MNVVETKVETQGKTPVLLSECLNCVVQVSVDGGQFRTQRLSKDESGNLGFSHGSASVQLQDPNQRWQKTTPHKPGDLSRLRGWCYTQVSQE